MESLVERFNYVITQLATSVFILEQVTVLLRDESLGWICRLMADLIHNRTDGDWNCTLMCLNVEERRNNYLQGERKKTETRCAWFSKACYNWSILLFRIVTNCCRQYIPLPMPFSPPDTPDALLRSFTGVIFRTGCLESAGSSCGVTMAFLISSAAMTHCSHTIKCTYK